MPSVASVQNEVLSANGRQLLVPEDVQIGDTWVSPNNTFMIALTNEAVSVNGPDGTTKTVDALLVVERSTQNDPLQASNAVSQCVNFFQSANNDYPDADTTHADSVKLDAQFTGPCIGGGQVGNGGYTNVAWYWYYKGLVVKMTKSSTTVRVYGVGYAHQTTNTCTKITLPVSAVPVTETSDYKPYVEFEVTTNMETFTATMIDDNASLLQDYLDQQAASESAGATTGN
ncbi:MAG: hypothetical protein D6761_07415 [Candidatus Dadabacteria bacterium]|nr:MAG: hypothetical protein D6761_07415 [Candidatus Dadabacteria bacterium]